MVIYICVEICRYAFKKIIELCDTYIALTIFQGIFLFLINPENNEELIQFHHKFININNKGLNLIVLYISLGH